MNRLLGVLPPSEAEAIAVSATVPLALRGGIEVASYAPSALPEASDDLLQRVASSIRATGSCTGSGARRWHAPLPATWRRRRPRMRRRPARSPRSCWRRPTARGSR